MKYESSIALDLLEFLKPDTFFVYHAIPGIIHCILTPIPSTVFMYNPHMGRLKFDLF